MLKNVKQLAHEWAKSTGYWDDDLYDPQESECAEDIYLAGIHHGLRLAISLLPDWNPEQIREKLESVLAGTRFV